MVQPTHSCLTCCCSSAQTTGQCKTCAVCPGSCQGGDCCGPTQPGLNTCMCKQHGCEKLLMTTVHQRLSYALGSAELPVSWRTHLVQSSHSSSMREFRSRSSATAASTLAAKAALGCTWRGQAHQAWPLLYRPQLQPSCPRVWHWAAAADGEPNSVSYRCIHPPGRGVCAACAHQVSAEGSAIAAFTLAAEPALGCTCCADGGQCGGKA